MHAGALVYAPEPERSRERGRERDVDPREQDPLDRAANRLCIRIHGCCLASLSRRDPEVIERLYRFAAEDRRRWQERQARWRAA